MKMTWFLGQAAIAPHTHKCAVVDIRQDQVANKDRFRIAWILFASIPLSHFAFTLLRAVFVNSGRRSPRMAGHLASVEIWASGVVWLLLGISLIMLLYSIIPKSNPNDTTSTLQQNSSDSAKAD